MAGQKGMQQLGKWVLGRCNSNQPLVINVYPHNSIAFHTKRKSNKLGIIVHFEVNVKL